MFSAFLCLASYLFLLSADIRWKIVLSTWRYAQYAEIPRDPEHRATFPLVFISPRVPFNDDNFATDNRALLVRLVLGWSNGYNRRPENRASSLKH